MGWRPPEVYAASVGEVLVCWEGWREVHTAPGDPEPMSVDRLEELMRMRPDE